MKNIAKVFVYVITILSIGTFKAQKTPPKKIACVQSEYGSHAPPERVSGEE